MKNRNKSSLAKGTKNIKKLSNNSYETVMDELYYSHLLELLFDHGSGNIEFTENQKKKNNKKPINNNKKQKGA